MAAFDVGDRVRVLADAVLCKRRAQGHGGWKDAMAEYCGRAGVVNEVWSDDDEGYVSGWDARVEFAKMAGSCEKLSFPVCRLLGSSRQIAR